MQQFFAGWRATKVRGGHPSGKQIQIARRGWQRVCLAIVGELQTVFEIAQEAVCGNQAAIFGGRQQVLVIQPAKRKQSAAMSNPGNAATVQSLQTLDQELNVADSPGR